MLRGREQGPQDANQHDACGREEQTSRCGEGKPPQPHIQAEDKAHDCKKAGSELNRGPSAQIEDFHGMNDDAHRAQSGEESAGNE